MVPLESLPGGFQVEANQSQTSQEESGRSAQGPLWSRVLQMSLRMLATKPAFAQPELFSFQSGP